MTEHDILSISAFCFGCSTGSFLNVCWYRIPKMIRGEAELTPFYPQRSFCPHCKVQLRWYHNIPFLSWFLLRGRCGFCHEPILWIYPALEFFGGITAFFFIQFLQWWEALALFLGITLLVIGGIVGVSKRGGRNLS